MNSEVIFQTNKTSTFTFFKNI